MEVALTEIRSTSPKRRIVLQSLPVMIGQGPDVGVCLEDQWVSRHHCQLDAIKGTVVVRDLGSMLGTFVNGLNVNRALVMPGDRLTVGVTSFLVDYDLRRDAQPPANDRPPRSPGIVLEDGGNRPPESRRRQGFARWVSLLAPQSWFRSLRRLGSRRVHEAPRRPR